jgi:hypothetical protein
VEQKNRESDSPTKLRPPGGRVLKVEQSKAESNASIKLGLQLYGKPREEVYQILIEAAGDSTARLTAVHSR